MHTRVRKIATVVALVAAGSMLTVGAEAAVHKTVNTNEWVKFSKTDATHPTNGITLLKIQGDGCLQAEDMTTLVLDNYDPANARVIYHCVQP